MNGINAVVETTNKALVEQPLSLSRDEFLREGTLGTRNFIKRKILFPFVRDAVYAIAVFAH